MTSSGEHWDEIFRTTDDRDLGWYEKDASQTFKMLEDVPDVSNATVFLPGAGTSILVDKLLKMGSKLLLNDVSKEALDRLRARIGERHEQVTWLCHDMSKPCDVPIPQVDIWIDRAVLHFLIEESDIAGYYNNLFSNVRPGGFVLFGEFSLLGATMCAGLPVHRYSVDELTERLGQAFHLVRHSEYTYVNPAGKPRPYIYALYKRKENIVIKKAFPASLGSPETI